MGGSSPKKPKKTAQELATEKRVDLELNKEIKEEEDRFKALTRGQLGRRSLLAGGSKTRAGSAGGASRTTVSTRTGGGTASSGGAGGGGRSLLGPSATRAN